MESGDISCITFEIITNDKKNPTNVHLYIHLWIASLCNWLLKEQGVFLLSIVVLCVQLAGVWSRCDLSSPFLYFNEDT